jgi:hypothetical protein
LVADGEIGEILALYAADRELEGHPGWRGERKRARRERRQRRREAKRLAEAGVIPASDVALDDEDSEEDFTMPARGRSGL